MARLVLAEDGQRLLEEGNRRPRVAAAERDLTQPGEPFGAESRRRALEKRRVEALGLVELVQTQSNLGLDENPDSVPPNVGAGRQIVLGDAEPAPELAQQLEGRNPVARLDARDVRGRAARKGELALAEARLLAGDLKSLAHSSGAVDMS